jgi:hypothetical protein
MLERLSARVVAIGVAGLALVLVILFGVNQCRSRQTASKQAEVSQGQGQASVGAGQEAMNTVSNVAGNAAATDATVAQGQGEVRGAPEAGKGAAAVNAACRFKANKNKPECQPKGPAR